MISLVERLQLTVPLIQAPMAGVSTPQLAGAVSNAGALGSIGLGALQTEAARQEIRALKALTSHAFNVNVFCHEPKPSNPAVDAAWLRYLQPCFQSLGIEPPDTLREIYPSFNGNDAMVHMLLEERPAVVSFHFGLPPQPVIQALRETGITLIATATNIHEAKAIAQAGLDGIVAQGIEAGGHRGVFNEHAPDEALGTFALTRLLVKNTNLPVISAGGIMDGAGIRAALSLGAQLAQMGTAFIACPESSADPGYRAAVLQRPTLPTHLIRAISGRPARGFANTLSQLETNPDCPPIPAYPYAYDATKLLNAAAKRQGSQDFAAHWAGQGVGLSRAMPAEALIRTLQRECQ
jgi:nitronate monooxygenase